MPQSNAHDNPGEIPVLPYASTAPIRLSGSVAVFIAITIAFSLAGLEVIVRLPRHHGCCLTPESICAGHLRELSMWVRIYADDDDCGEYPDSLSRVIALVRHDTRGMRCPNRRAGDDTTGYYYVLGLTEHDPLNWPIAFDDPDNHADVDRVIIAFQDMRVRWMSKADFFDMLGTFFVEFEASRGHPPKLEGPDTKLPAAWQSLK